MIRDKETTKQKLIDSVGKIILTQGFKGVGVNAVAKEAGVDKVLIYRYFNDLNGLLKAYIMQKDYYSNISNSFSEFDPAAPIEDIKSFSKEVLIGQLRYILNDKEFQEILLWELVEKNEITSTIANEREKQGISILKKISKAIGKTDQDLSAISALLLGGIYYLTLRSNQVKVFNGIDISSEKGWKRIEKSIVNLIDLAVK